jgi:hypothetical protein
MKQKKPQTYVMVEVPDCRMHGSATVEGQIVMTLGWPKDHTVLQFKRRALRRFIRLAADLLAASPDDTARQSNSDHVSTPD